MTDNFKPIGGLVMCKTRADYCKKQMDKYAELMRNNLSAHRELYENMWREYKREYDFYRWGNA